MEDTNPGYTPFGYAGGLYDYRTHLVRFWRAGLLSGNRTVDGGRPDRIP